MGRIPRLSPIDSVVTLGFLLVGEKWYFSAVLICISFIISEVEHLSICLNAIGIYFYANCFPTVIDLFLLYF